jgi:hypothetical protein
MNDRSRTAVLDQDPEFARKLLWRIGWLCVPILLIAYVIACVDRVNVGFAAIMATKDLGMSLSVFGFGAALNFSASLSRT